MIREYCTCTFIGTLDDLSASLCVKLISVNLVHVWTPINQFDDTGGCNAVSVGSTVALHLKVRLRVPPFFLV